MSDPNTENRAFWSETLDKFRVWIKDADADTYVRVMKEKYAR